MSTRILLINEFPSLNGGERSLLANLMSQRDQFEFIAAIPEGDFAESLNNAGIKTIPLDTSDDEGLATLIDRSRPDLIHANSLNMSRRVGRIASQIPVPILGHCRDIFGLSKKAVADLNQLTKMVFVSQAALDYHVAQGVRADFATVIHNGVDLDQFQPRSPAGFLHRELDLPTSARILLSIGQIGMRKGLDFLLDVFLQVAAQNEDAHLLIVGQRYSQKDEAVEYEQQLFDRCCQAPLDERVCFLGIRDDVPTLMNEATMLVHSARQEPLGRVLLEACASGLPVVATDVGGTREIFPSNDCGAALADSDDRDKFAAGVLQILSDHSIEQNMRIEARRRAESAFDCNESARQVSEIYRYLTN